jgi:hypothetical protein
MPEGLTVIAAIVVARVAASWKRLWRERMMSLGAVQRAGITKSNEFLSLRGFVPISKRPHWPRGMDTFTTHRRIFQVPCAIRSVIACLLMAGSLAANETGYESTYKLSARDASFLDDLQRRAVRYFVEQTEPATGLTLDRSSVDGGIGHSPSSVAATGFALTAWCIADARGWSRPGDAVKRVRHTLRFLVQHHAHEHGFFYHFVDASTGQRAWKSEASTIDTALLLQGALFAREYLRDKEVTALVEWIYARIDWQWAMNDGRTLSHGWLPEIGFIEHRWERYAELLGLYLLGIGAPRKPLPAEAWHAWSREPRVSFGERTFIQCGPLFTHQYAHGWFDFRGRRDTHADYWQNSVDATLAQRAWSAAQQSRYKYWSTDFWGLTASDSQDGYIAWGTPGPGEPDMSDGTVVPCAPGGSLPFAPAECIAALRRMRELGGPRAWGRYGFVDAFNPHTGWASNDVIGINVGITLVMAENLRTGDVWRAFMRAPEVQRGMKLAGFSGMNASPVTVPVLALTGAGE